MKKRVLFFSPSRSDFGIMSPVLREFHNDDSIDVSLVLTGSHLNDTFGNSQLEISDYHYDFLHKIEIENIGTSDPNLLIEGLGSLLKNLGKLLKTENPQMLILLGDRMEILLPAYCALLNNIPIAHIGGGDITTGAIDDQIRNSVSQISNYHFVTNTSAHKRLVDMQIPDENIFHSGSPSEAVIATVRDNPHSKKEVLDELNIQSKERLLVCTFHPETKSKSTLNNLQILLNSLANLDKDKYLIIFTASNGDVHGKEFNNLIQDFSSNRDNFYFFPSLGIGKYLTLLSVSDLVVGNSSSGLHEAPSMNIPTLDVGNRQDGRARSKSVMNVDINEEKILKGIDHLISNKDILNYENPYISDLNSSYFIYSKIRKLLMMEVNS